MMVAITSTLFLLLSSALGASAQHSGGAKLPDRSTYEEIGEVAAVTDRSEVEYVNSGPLGTLYDFLIRHNLMKLCNLLRKANLEAYLVDSGPLTIFAPLDGSFAFLPGGTLEDLERNPRLMQEFLLHHFLSGELVSTQILDEMEVVSMQGSPLRFNIYGPQDVITVSGAEILESDLEFDLGRLYIIDRPLYPHATADLLGTIQTTHQEFYRLIFLSGLTEFLSGGTFTLLAPDDRSFDYLSVDLKEALAKNQSLAEAVVLSHVLPQSIFVRGVANGIQMQSVGGTDLLFTQRRGLTFVNGIPVVMPDVPATNGVVHTINRVILPEGVESDCHCKPLTTKRGSSSVSGQLPGQPQRPTQPRPGSRGNPVGRPPVGTVPRHGPAQRPSSATQTQRPSVGRVNTPTGQRPGVAQRPTTPTLAPSIGNVNPSTGSRPEDIPTNQGSVRGGGSPPGRGRRPSVSQQGRPPTQPTGQGPEDDLQVNVIQEPNVVPTSRPRVTQRQQTPAAPRPLVTTSTPGRVKQPLRPPINVNSQRPPIGSGVNQPNRVRQTPSTQRPWISNEVTEIELEEVVNTGTPQTGSRRTIPQGNLGTQPQRPHGRQPSIPVKQPAFRSTVSPRQRTQPEVRNQFRTTRLPPSILQPETETYNYVDSRIDEYPNNHFDSSRNALGEPNVIQPPTLTRPGQQQIRPMQPARPGISPVPQPGQRPGLYPVPQPGQRPGLSPVPQQGQRPGISPVPQPGQRPGLSPPVAQPGQRPRPSPAPQLGQRPGQSPVRQPGQPGQRTSFQPGPSYDSQPASIPQQPNRVLPGRRGNQPTRVNNVPRPVDLPFSPDIAELESPESLTPPLGPGSSRVGQPPNRFTDVRFTGTTPSLQPNRFSEGRQTGTPAPRRPLQTTTSLLFPNQRTGTRTSHATKGQPYDPQRHPPQRQSTGRFPNSPSIGIRQPVAPPNNPSSGVRQPIRPANNPLTGTRQPISPANNPSPGTRQPVGPSTGFRQPFNPNFIGSSRRPSAQPGNTRLNCRSMGQRVTPATQSLPLCQDIDNIEPCQRLDVPFNPRDPRPPCRDNSPYCRRPEEGDDPLDTRPLCDDINALCRLTGEPMDPNNPLPVCFDEPSNCRRPDEVYNPQDRRPLCAQIEIDNFSCRLPEDQTFIGDTRPICSRNPLQDIPLRQPNVRQQPNPRQPTGSRNQPAGRRPASPNVDAGLVGCRQFGEVKAPSDRRPLCPVDVSQEITTTTTRFPHIPNTLRPDGDQAVFSPPSSNVHPNTPPPVQRPEQPSTTTCRQPSERLIPGDTRTLCLPTRRPTLRPVIRPNSQQQPNNRITSQNRGTTRPPTRTTLQPLISDSPCRNVGDPLRVGDRRPLCSSQLPQSVQEEMPEIQRPARPLAGVQQDVNTHTTVGTQPTTSGQSGGVNQPFGNRQQQTHNPPSLPGSRGNQRVTTSTRNPSNQPGSRGNQRVTTSTRTSLVPTSPSRRPSTGTLTTTAVDEPRTLYQIVEEPALLIQGRPVKLNKIFELFHKAGLEYILTDPGPHTVFFPSDDAFLKLPKGVVDQLETNPEFLRQVLLFHIASTEILPAGREESYSVPSLQGIPLLITMFNGGRMILISGAKAVAVTRASNGIFYVINELLYPMPQDDIVSALDSRPDMTQFASLIRVGGLEDILRGEQPYTIFAPTDNAFGQLSNSALEGLVQNSTAARELLLGHIIEGAHYGREFLSGGSFSNVRGGKMRVGTVSFGYQVNDVNIKTPEIVTGTGVIHMIDSILLTPQDIAFFDRLQPSIEDSDVGTGLDNPTTISGSLSGNELNPSTGFTTGVNRVQTTTRFHTSISSTQSSMSHGRGSSRPSSTSAFTRNQIQPVRVQSVHNTRQGNGGSSSSGTRPISQGHSTVAQTGSRTQSSAHHGIGGSSGHQVSGMVGPHTGIAQLASDLGLTRFADFITMSGLHEKIEDGGTYTVFAPTDDALNRLTQNVLDGLNSEDMRELLSYHIVPQKLSEKTVRNDETSSTLLQGKKLRFNLYYGGQVQTALGVPVEQPQDVSSSVRIIPVNQVLEPPLGNLLTIVETSHELTEFANAIKKYHLNWMLSGEGGMTLFAPSNTAFQSLNEEDRKKLIENRQGFTNLLKSHLLRGTLYTVGLEENERKRTENGKPVNFNHYEGGVSVNTIPIVVSDIPATNGVVHIIDEFL